MSGFPILDLVAGMIFIYFLLSIINNSMFEIFAAITKLRATFLRKWLEETFKKTMVDPNTGKEKTLSQAIMDHPMIEGLSKKGKSNTYLSASDFSAAIIDLFTADTGKLADSIDNIENALKETKVLPESMKRTLLFFAAQARELTKVEKNTKSTIEEFSHAVENWFDHSMQRLTGKFKRRSLLFTVIFGSALTLALNLDSISLLNYFYNHPKELAVVNTAAAAEVKDSSRIKEYNKSVAMTASTDTLASESSGAHTDSVIKEIRDKSKKASEQIIELQSFIPIGWNTKEYQDYDKSHGGTYSCGALVVFCLIKICGLAITVLALSLGAPFWFDVLGKVANIRSSMKPATSAEENK